MSLGEYWETVIRQQIGIGRYGSARELVREALRGLEAREAKLAALRDHLSEGMEQSRQGRYVEAFSFEKMLYHLDHEIEADNRDS